MLTDGLQLLGDSTAVNFAIDSGAFLPIDATSGELFYLNGIGLHVHDGASWVLVGTGATVDSASIVAALGYTPAALENGKIALSQIPAVAVTDTFVVDTQAAMLGLTAEVGDVAVRTDTNTTYILRATNPTVLANWVQLLNPTSDVTSVNGLTGTVVLTSSAIDEGTNLYFTNTRARSAISVTGDGGSYNSTTGVITIAPASSSNFTLTNGAGGNTQVQYNANGILTGSPGFTWLNTTSTLTLGVAADNGTINSSGQYLFIASGGTSHISVSAAQFSCGPRIDALSGIRSARGGASLPGYAFFDDTDTGIFSSTTANVMAFATGGVQRMAITDTGAIAVGTSNGGYGTTGQVLTSQGNATPIWTTVAAGGGSGTVTSVSVATANGVSGTVATETTTPAITLTLGNITPTYVTTPGAAVSAAAGTYRSLFFSTTGTNGGRWIMGANNTTESATTGSDFFLTRQYNDGTQNIALTVARGTGVFDFKAAPTVNGVAIGSAAAAGSLTGTTLAANVVTASLSTIYAASTIFKTSGEAAGTIVLGANAGPGGVIRGHDLPSSSVGNLTIRPGDVQFSSTQGGQLSLTGGSNVSTGAGANGGHVVVTGGPTSSTGGVGGNAALIGGTAPAGGTAGSVVISAGSGSTAGTTGVIRMSTGASTVTERFRITALGGFAVGGAANVGTSGQVLTSNGDASPTWTSPSATVIPYDISGAVLQKPGASMVILRFLSVRTFTIPAGMTGSRAVTATPSTASYTLSVQKNGVQFGTITFAAGASTGTFAAASQASFVAGDLITVVAPVTPDATFNDAAFTIIGVL